MVRWLTGLLDQAADRILHDLVSSICVAVTVALLVGISLGFGAFAAYGYLRDIFGGVIAALIVGAGCGLIALAIWGNWTIRQGKTHPVKPAAAPTPPVDPIVSLLKSLVETDSSQDQSVMAAAERLGRELSPLQLVALAVVGGLIVGRMLDK